MREQLIQYVNLLFAGCPENGDMKQEILQNTLDRYDDLLAQGKAPEAAYRLAITGIGDINEVLGSTAPSPAPMPTATSAAEEEKSDKKKLMRAVAIGMYICCVLPLFILGNIGNGIIGLCLMFLLIAAATVLMVMASSDKEEKEQEDQQKSKQTPLDKTLNTVALVLFLALSFFTGAWHITWLIWPIMAAVKGIIRAYGDLKGGREE
jgi:Na+-transporting methylmalonyl-CoA/oxaloacetate decarboxylase gamma subunit